MYRILPQTMSAIVAIAAILFADPANAAEPHLVGQFGNWSAYMVGAKKSKVCYVHSEPVESKGKYKSRGRVFVQAAHRPAEKVQGEFSVTAGYTYKPHSAVLVGVDKKTFKLFTKDDGAWLEDSKSDHMIVRYMKKGIDMFVTGTSNHGTKTTDKYSLKGFTAAYNAINKACGYK